MALIIIRVVVIGTLLISTRPNSALWLQQRRTAPALNADHRFRESPIDSLNSWYEVEVMIAAQQGKPVLPAERRDPNVI